MTSHPWGKILVGVRLEKTVSDVFFSVWTGLLENLRPGDEYAIARGEVAHRAANRLARYLLESDCDTLLFLDSDADIEPDFLERFRSYEPGYDYDVLQAFYTRRGWPPEAVWLKKDSEGVLKKVIVLGEETEEVSVVGLHATLIRREVFERLLGDNKPDTFDWFYYPQNTLETEDAAFSKDAIAAGYRIGATSGVKAGHISQLTIGWESYQEWLYTSGYLERIERYGALMALMVDFTRLPEDTIANLAARGSKNVLDAWKKYEPYTADQVRGFYGLEPNGYLWDLFYWNTSFGYIRLTAPLKKFSGQTALVIGGGLGSEAALLADQNNVDVYDLPGLLREFCKFRFRDSSVNILAGDRLEQSSAAERYSLIVAVDVIEHVHPDEISGFLDWIAGRLSDGGVLFCHNNFGQQDIYPMHFDHSATWNAWVEQNGLIQESDYVWRKPGKETT